MSVFNPWFWLIAGLLVCIAEMLLPGAYLLWIGTAAILTGGLLYGAAVFDVSLTFEAVLLAFGALAVVSMLIGRSVYGSLNRGAAPAFLNRRADELVGQVFALDAAIVDGKGRIRVNDSVWSVRGGDAEAGAKVRVTGVEGGVHLRVERV